MLKYEKVFNILKNKTDKLGFTAVGQAAHGCRSGTKIKKIFFSSVNPVAVCDDPGSLLMEDECWKSN